MFKLRFCCRAPDYIPVSQQSFRLRIVLSIAVVSKFLFINF